MSDVTQELAQDKKWENLSTRTRREKWAEDNPVSDSDGETVIPVPDNPFKIAPIQKRRPYISSDGERNRWMRLNRDEQGMLLARIGELQGRYEQMCFILDIYENDLYLIEADRTVTTTRMKDSYFAEWLKEMEIVHGVRIAGEWLDKISKSTGEITDGIATMIQGCVNAGMTLDKAVAVAAIGKTAIKDLLRSGAMVKKSAEDGTVVYDRGPSADDVMGEGTPVSEYLEGVASSSSSKGASLAVRNDIGVLFHKYAVWVDDDRREEGGWKLYNMEVEEINPKTGEKTPYKAMFMVEKDAPPSVAKAALKNIVGENLSRVVFW